jgi:hypothetical protein
VRVEFTTCSRGYVLTLERDLFGALSDQGAHPVSPMVWPAQSARRDQKADFSGSGLGPSLWKGPPHVPVSDQSPALPHLSTVFSGTGSLAVD